MITTIKLTRSLFWPRRFESAHDEAKAIGRKKLMIVTYPDIRKAGHLDRFSTGGSGRH